MNENVSQHEVDLFEPNTATRGRKRVRQEELWKRNVCKIKRAHGQKYITNKGKTIHAKEVDVTSCGCKRNCNLQIDPERQKQICQEFYGLGSFNLQSAFLFSMIKVVNKERTYTAGPISRRDKTRVYCLIGTGGDERKVCKTFFQKTLQVSAGRIDRVLKQKGNESVAPTDRRGSAPSVNKTPTETVNDVKLFIERFPAYESHYALHKSSRKYLAPDLNLNIMYQLYCEDKQNPVSKHMFRKIFNEQFNLSFHAPLSDTCRKCDNFDVKIRATEVEDEKKTLLTEKELHLRKAEAARSGRQTDATNGKSDNDLTVIAFDLMKTLPTPRLTTGVAYYKRQLWTYLLGIHNLATDDVVMFLWDESTASRGSQEVGSCILYYVKHFVNTTKLIMYSDQCGGQNRNIKMSVLCQYIVSHPDYTVTEIDHKFMVSGHSYLQCDQDFGLVEKQKKFFKDIYIPDHWSDVVKAARKKNPFTVVKMKSENFFSTKTLETNIVNRKVSNDTTPVQWLKIQWLRFVQSDPFTIRYKYSNNPDVHFSKVNLQKRTSVITPILNLLYPNGRSITKQKKQDLLHLLDYVPPLYHNFFKNLQVNNNNTYDYVDDVDDFNTE